MAKGQQKSNKETRKPKKDAGKPKTIAANPSTKDGGLVDQARTRG